MLGPMFWHARGLCPGMLEFVSGPCAAARADAHAYHALTRGLGLCAVACADAFARTYVLALPMPAACAMP